MTELVIVAAYASLALELVLIPVPSVASARSLAARGAARPDRTASPRLRLYLPVVLNIAVFLLPLVEALARLQTGAFARGTASAWSATTIAGVLLIVVGRGVTIASARAMRRAADLRLGEGTLDVGLKTGGLFARSRNPGLVGMYLFALGVLLVQPNPWFALGLMHYLWHMHRKVLLEERFLEHEHGTAYTEYRMHTRRYV